MTVCQGVGSKTGYITETSIADVQSTGKLERSYIYIYIYIYIDREREREREFLVW